MRPLPALALVFVFGIALFVRLYDWAPPTIIAERQYRSALIARAFYFEARGDVPDWRRSVARASIAYKPTLEPPLLEWVVSRVYLVLGRESPWVPRLLSTTFWLLGGVFLLRIARRFGSPSVALILTAYYLLLPTGVHVSVSFLPDALMILLFLASLLTILRYFENRTTARLIVASLVSAFAVGVKPLCLFAILGAFVGLAILTRHDRGRLLDGQVVMFLVSVFALGGAYYANGLVLNDYMATQAQNSFVPRALLSGAFWIRTPLYAIWTVGFIPLLLGFLGASTHEGRNLGFVLGLWAGYIVFCLIFAYHVHITGHYHLQLAPVVALSAAPLVSTLLERLKPTLRSWSGVIAAAAALALVIPFALYRIRETFVTARMFESPALAQQIGELVGHSTRVVFVASYYGVPLEYFGEMAGREWPRPLQPSILRSRGEGVRSVVARLGSLEEVPDYFVITDFAEFDKHHRDLQTFLATECQRLAEGEGYVIYDTRDCARLAILGAAPHDELRRSVMGDSRS